MAKARKAKTRRDPLVFRHLERVSRKLLEKHPDIVRKFIGGNAGIYALYRKERIYYVGLAHRLSGRLKAHLRDRHKNAWDSFSIYLTINVGHMKEIESLFLQIARPPGNAVGGKPSASRDLIRIVRKEIKAKLERETDLLVGRIKATTGEKIETREEAGALMYFLPRGGQLQATNRGKVYKARLLKNGRIRYAGNDFNSVSQAASNALGRPTNGWWFWQVQRGRGHWVRLKEIRRAGTPM